MGPIMTSMAYRVEARFGRDRGLRLPLALEALEFAGEGGAGGGFHAVDEEDAVEVIGPVLESCSEVTVPVSTSLAPPARCWVGSMRGLKPPPIIGLSLRDKEAEHVSPNRRPQLIPSASSVPAGQRGG